MLRRALLTLALGAAAAPAAAHADQLLDPAVGGVNVSAGGGFTVWAAPVEDTGWQLVVRAPDGTVTRPEIDDFAAPPDPSVRTGNSDRPGVVAVYSRTRGGGSDVYALDLATGREHLVSGISTAGADEIAPSISRGRVAFVRRGGRHPGVYAWNGRVAARRLSPDIATQTAISVGRVAWTTTRSVRARKASGRGRTVVFPTASRPRSLVLTLYRAGWLEDGGRVLQTSRLEASGPKAFPATRALPPATESIALEGRAIALRLGADGLQRIDPALRFAG